MMRPGAAAHGVPAMVLSRPPTPACRPTLRLPGGRARARCLHASTIRVALAAGWRSASYLVKLSTEKRGTCARTLRWSARRQRIHQRFCLRCIEVAVRYLVKATLVAHAACRHRADHPAAPRLLAPPPALALLNPIALRPLWGCVVLFL